MLCCVWPGGAMVTASTRVQLPVAVLLLSLGKLFTDVLLSPSSMVWYWSMDGDTLKQLDRWPRDRRKVTIWLYLWLRAALLGPTLSLWRPTMSTDAVCHYFDVILSAEIDSFGRHCWSVWYLQGCCHSPDIVDQHFHNVGPADTVGWQNYRALGCGAK